MLAVGEGVEKRIGAGAREDRAFRALAHSDRRTLLRLLRHTERSVGELTASVKLSQPIVSQHLKVLRTAELVQVRSDGNRRLYSLDAAHLDELRDFLDAFWTTKLGALKCAAET